LLLISLKNWVLQRTILESTTKPDGSVSTYTYYGYDNNGNQISEWTRIANVSESTEGVNLGLQNEATDDLLTLYAYDAFDRLVKIEQGADVIENAYTADGKKFSRTTNGVLTYYVYDGNVVLNEQCSNNAIIARNVYGRNLISRDTFHGDGNYSYNGHGDVIRWNNKSLNMFIEYDYDEFGNIVSEETYDYSINTFAPSGVIIPDYADDRYNDIEFNVVVTPYRYAGYEYIEEIGIYDLNARYYNPEIARFLSQDPYYNLGNRVIGLYEINVPTATSMMQANNIYVYCGNNPVTRFDTEGEFFGTIIGTVVGAVSGAISAAAKGDNIWVGAVTGAVSGAVTGVITDFAVATGGTGAILLVAGVNALANVGEHIITEKANGRELDFTAIIIEASMGAIVGSVFYGAFGEISNVGTGNVLTDFMEEGFEKLSKATAESVSKDVATSFVEGTINDTLSEQVVLVYEKNRK